MFNIGFTELLILGVIGLLVVGPEQLPELAKKVSRLLNDLKRAKDEIMEPLDDMKSEAQTALLRMRNELEQQNAKLSQVAQKATEIKKPEIQSEADDKNQATKIETQKTE